VREDPGKKRIRDPERLAAPDQLQQLRVLNALWLEGLNVRHLSRR
jgi:hypothetical protein